MPWHVTGSGGFARDTQEAQDNAVMIASILTSKGWSLKSICAALGNIQGEGAMNPWRWDGDYVPTYNEAWGWTQSQLNDHGYGLFMYTWFTFYATEGAAYDGFGVNYRDRAGSQLDGQAQILYMNDDLERQNSPYGWNTNHFQEYQDQFLPNGIDISSFYYMSIADFKAGINYTLDELTGAFQLCYERPRATVAYGGYLFRTQTAQYYYDYLSTVPIPPFVTSTGMKWIYWLKPRWKRGF